MRFKIIKNLLKVNENSEFISVLKIEELENKLNYTLPDVLKDFYLIFKGLTKIEELEFDEKNYMTFFKDSYNNMEWAIQKSDLEKEHFVFLKYPNAHTSWQLESLNLEKTLEALGLYCMLTDLKYFALKFKIEELEEEKVYSDFDKIDIELPSLNYTFYQNQPNELIGINKSDEGVNLYVASNNKRDFSRNIKLFENKWYHKSAAAQIIEV